ncbi:WD_REPEATS_REGION domain-containing protein, partial [Haematococcus lacustris]
MQCNVRAELARDVDQQLARLYATQTSPWQLIIKDYAHLSQQLREQQVRLSQLDKEGAELRDENSTLHSQVAALEEMVAGDWKTKAELAQRSLQAAQEDSASAQQEKVSLT